MAKSDVEIKESMNNKNEKMVVSRLTNVFMREVEDFLKRKAGGEIPVEWNLSLTMLRIYYKQFIAVSRELEKSGDWVSEGKRGPVPNALLQIQAHAATRLEKAMSELGLSLKSSKKLGLSEPKKDETALDAFFKTTMGMESTMEIPEEDEE